MNMRAKPAYEFGPFRLDAAERVLFQAGAPVPLPPKVLDTLLVLVQHHGHIVEKEELMEQIWPDTMVEENNLNKTVSAVRKALGEGPDEPKYIETIPRRGYRFVAPVRELVDDQKSEGLRSPFAIRHSPSAIRTIAVLPFKSLSPDRTDDYLGLGMTDALITRFSNIRQVIVRPTSAVLKYQASAPDPVAAGQALGVESVLEGAIRRSADRVRVTVQLVSVGSGAPLWAEKFDEDFTDIFTVEDSISERVARALMLKLTSEERDRLVKHPTDNAAAYQLYLQGRYHASKFTPEGVQRGFECFQQAVALDPGYALAYEGLAYYYFVSANEFSLPSREAMPKTKAAALQALQLDDARAEAHMYLAAVQLWYEWDWPTAEKEFQRAIDLNPHNPLIREYYGQALVWMGQVEAGIAEGQRAVELDPLSPETNNVLGICLYFARRYDEALEQFQRALEIEPTYWFAYLQLGRAYEQTGRLVDAIEALETGWRIEDAFPELLAVLAHAYAVAGQPGRARSLIEEVIERSQRDHVSAYHIATAYAGLGETDRAFAWLEKAYDERSFFLTWLQTDPALDPLRSDPRLADLRRRVGLAA